VVKLEIEPGPMGMYRLLGFQRRVQGFGRIPMKRFQKNLLKLLQIQKLKISISIG